MQVPSSPLGRRRFVAGSAAALVAALSPATMWPLQAIPRASGAVPQDNDWLPTSTLLRTLPRLLELSEVPGLALGVVQNGRVWDGGFGRANADPKCSVEGNTVFEAVSLGKPIFAYAVLRLVDAGVIDLNRPLYDYLPIPEADNPLMRRVTPRHVLSHTTGLPNWRDRPGPLSPVSEPGTQFSYSGEAFLYLQRVVELLTKVPFARFMREQVLDPFGMKESSFVWLPRFEGRKASGRDQNGKELDIYGALGIRAEQIAQQWKKPVLNWRYEDAERAVPLLNPEWPVLPLYMIPSSAGSLLTTARDYARFLARVVAKPPAGGLELSEATRKAMSTPQVRLNRALYWGLGWGIQRDDHGEVLWHWGANNSFRNFVVADTLGHRAVVAFTNGEGGPKVYERVISAITRHDHPAFLWL
ncbi:MAG: serine hydrolase domain-containing protein [Gemmatimonadales bacterium]